MTYTTLANALYIDRNNDLGFVVNDRHLVMSECQSTINWNIPMRCLGYVNRTLREPFAGREGLYGRQFSEISCAGILSFSMSEVETWNA